MKFFKKILTFSVVAILLLCLVGCGNQNTETAIANNLEKSTTNLMSTLNKLEEMSYNDIVIKEISPLADSTYNTVNTSALQKIKWHTIGKTVNLEPDVKFVNAQLTYGNENSNKTNTNYDHKTQEITDDVTYSYKPKYVNNVSDSFSRKHFNSFVNNVENIYCQCSDCISCDAECKNTKDQLKNNINDTQVLCQKLRDGTIKMKAEDIENCKTQINNLNDCIKRLARTNGNVNSKCNDIKNLKENFSSHIGSVQDAYSRLLNTLETRLDYLDCCNEKLNEICDVINQTNVNKTEVQNNLSDEKDIAKIENNEIVKNNGNTEQNAQNNTQNEKDNNHQNIHENSNQNVTESKNNSQPVENQNGNQNNNQNNTYGTNQNSISNQMPNQTNNNVPSVQNVTPQQNTIPNANAPYYNNGAYNGNGVYNGYNNGYYNGYNYNYPPRNIDTYQNIEKNIDTYSPKFPVLNNQNANGINSNGTNNVVTASQSNEVTTKTAEEKTSKDEKDNDKQENKKENSIEKILKKDSQNNRQIVAQKKKMPKRKEAIKPIDDGKSNNIDSPLPNPYDDKKIDEQKEKLEKEKPEKNNDAKSETEEKSLRNTKTNENEKINKKLLKNNQTHNKNYTMQNAMQSIKVKPFGISKTNLVVDEENHHCHQTLN